MLPVQQPIERHGSLAVTQAAGTLCFAACKLQALGWGVAWLGSCVSCTCVRVCLASAATFAGAVGQTHAAQAPRSAGLLTVSFWSVQRRHAALHKASRTAIVVMGLLGDKVWTRCCIEAHRGTASVRTAQPWGCLVSRCCGQLPPAVMQCTAAGQHMARDGRPWVLQWLVPA